VVFEVQRLHFCRPDGSFVLTPEGKPEKTFRQRRPDPGRPDAWIYSVEGVETIPYRLPELLEAIAADRTIPVFIAEGEAKADALRSWGLTATCCVCGAGTWRAEHSEYLRGAPVVILPDNDEAGRKHARSVAQSLQGIATSIRIVDLPELSTKGDIVDWIKGKHTHDELMSLVDAAGEWVAESEASPADDDDAPYLAKPYVPPDPAAIPKREWLGAGRHYMRRTVSATIGATARGKSTNELLEIVGFACGKNLLTLTGEPLPTGPLRAGYLNAEEDQDELDRKFASICDRHGIKPEDIGNRLVILSVKNEIAKLKVAIPGRGGGAVLNTDAVERLKRKTEGLDAVSFDPLISFHDVRENDNKDMDIVIKQAFGAIASANNCAVDVVHHVGKPKPGATENTVDDGRGASAILAAVRAARVLNVMSTKEAGQLGVIEAERRQHVRISNGKANYAPPSDKAEWIKIENVTLANGDNVGVGTLWKPKNAFDGLPSNAIEVAVRLAKGADFRADPQSGNWFGKALADTFKMSLRCGTEYEKADQAPLKKIIKTWINNKVLAIEPRNDEHGHKKKFIVPGPNATGTLDDNDEMSDE
jgi:hypothetical protein